MKTPTVFHSLKGSSEYFWQNYTLTEKYAFETTSVVFTYSWLKVQEEEESLTRKNAQELDAH